MSSPLSANLEAILDRFDAAWNEPTPPCIEDYLREASPGQRLTMLIELVLIDLERRLAAGEKVRLEEVYFPRFPELAADLPAIVTLVKHEYAVRLRNEPHLMPREYLERFPQCQTELLAQLPTLEETRDRDRQQNAANAPAGLDKRGYELIETLGKGGMGEVYRCVDPVLGRDLAIKVMKSEYRGLADAERRFVREARVTGSLQHPGIVPIHNLGRLSDGRLHYTMRLVRGRTLADILKDEAGKPERLPHLLSIFEKICQAVAYAHSNRVLHRDLKPANVMVGRFGEVQVMDWGLAKVLTDGERGCVSAPSGERGCVSAPREQDAAGTHLVTEADTPVDLSRTGSGMGTPAYMPPEQALGEWDNVDERADVFALGSILCEILTGRPAYSSTDAKEVYSRARLGDMTEALQRLQQCAADADLTMLCRACLSPHRENRPLDADAVAKRVAEHRAAVQERLRQAEIERAEAVLRAREERKRRRLLIALVLASLAGAALTTWQAVRASAERDRKEIALGIAESARIAETSQRQLAEGQKRRAEDNERKAKASEEATKSVLAFFEDKILAAGRPTDQEGGLGRNVSLRQAVDKAAKDIANSFKDRPLVEAAIRATLGSTYWFLGETPLAIKQHERALALRMDKLGPDHDDTLVSRNNLAAAYRNAGRIADAIPLLEQTLKQREATLGADHSDTLLSRNNLAETYLSAGRFDEAIRLHEQTLKQREAMLGPDHPQTLTSVNNLTLAYQQAGRIRDAIPLHEQILKQREATLGADHPDTLILRNNLAGAYRNVGRLAEAIPLYEQTLKQREAALGSDHPDTLLSRNNLAETYQFAGRIAEAIRLHEPTLKQMEAKLGVNHPYTFISRNNLALAYSASGRLADAIRLFEQTLKQMEAKLGTDHPYTLTTRDNLAGAYHKAGRTSDAIPLFEQTLKQSEAKLGPNHPATLTSRNNLGTVYLAGGRIAEAIRLYEQTLKQREAQLGPDHTDTLLSLANLGAAYRDAERFKEAVALLESAIDRGRKRSGGTPVQLAWVHGALAQTYDRAGQFSKSESIYRDSLHMAQRQFGVEDPRTAGQMAALGLNLLHQHKYPDAEQMLRDSLKVRTAKQPDAWTTFNVRSLLGAALLGQKKYKEAEPLLLQGYEGMKARSAKIPPQGKVRLTEALERLVQLYEATDQKDKVAQWQKKLQESKAAAKKPKS